ncbi:MAG: RNA methyltransferase [Syntrophus sp. (in: bacteria)]
MITRSNCCIALLHYPVFNKHRNIVTTAVANMDVHDISRVARTYGMQRFYIVTPIEVQRVLVQSILDHWQQGYGATYNPSRREAFEHVCVKETFAMVGNDIKALSGRRPRLVVTGASLNRSLTSFKKMKSILEKDDHPYLIVFGTGWGLADGIVDQADYCLEPVRGRSDYNHLSVRSAAAVVLDRLFGK